MTKRESRIIDIAREIKRLLDLNIEIQSNGPIHEKLTGAVNDYEIKSISKR